MSIFSPIRAYVTNSSGLRGCLQGMMSNQICGGMSQAPSSTRFYHSTPSPKPTYFDMSISKTSSYSSVVSCFRTVISKQRSICHSLTVRSISSSRRTQKTSLDIFLGSQNMNLRLSVPKQGVIPNIRCNVGPVSLLQGCASAGLIFGLLVCYSTVEPVHAEAKEDDCDSSSVSFSHGKKVYTNYSVIGIPGDGRCLFRSVAHGASLRSGKSAPNESLQRELADELRARVADEFIKRRQETEWFIEGDFDAYVSQMRKPHVWGGEPELLMASHVLEMPITVYMYDRDSGGLISIAEYGQEYDNQNPIKVLYNGSGHYDALQIPGKKGAKSRL